MKKFLLFAIALFFLNVLCNAQHFDPPQENPFGLTELVPAGSTPAFADLDGDGDLDMMSGDGNYGSFWYFKNIGTASSPSFAAVQENPFGLTELVPAGSTPAFADLDGDDDFDMMSGDGNYGSFWYFKNSGTQGIFEVPKDQMPVIVYPNPSSGMFAVSIKNGKIKAIEINNMLGEMIYQTTVEQLSKKTIVLSSFPKGIYFVKIYDGEIYYTEKIVIQ